MTLAKSINSPPSLGLNLGLNLGLCLLSALLPHLATAKEHGDTSTDKNNKPIEVLTVTAQKRAQNVGDVAVSVTAFVAGEIKALRLSQPADLAAHTPNLNVNNTFQNSIPNFSIRGLGLNDYAVNNNPATGIYVDEVYLSSPAMLGFQLFDIERIEVLRGPQGTLYGRNTTAGAITFVSAKPGEDSQAYVSLDYNRSGRAALSAAVSGQLSENLNGRLAGTTVQLNTGHQYNRFTDDNVGAVNKSAFRAMLDWQPAEELILLFNIHGGTDHSDSWLVKIDNTFIADDDPAYPGNPYHSGGNANTLMNISSEGAAMTLRWHCSDSTTLTAISGYENTRRQHTEDRDGSALVHLDGEYLNQIEQISQELRLTYIGEKWVLIGGLFYAADEIETRDRFDITDLPFDFNSIGNEYRQKARVKGGFMHSEYRLSSNYMLTTGLRHTRESKEFSDAFTFVYIGGTPSNGGEPFNIFDPVNTHYEVRDLSGKIGVNYTGIKDTLLYASISKGFKSGGFQGQLAFTPDDLAAFEAENVVAYELGLKTAMPGHGLQMDAAAFFYDYTDMQMYGPLFYSEALQTHLFGIDNVGDAALKGLELTLAWHAGHGFEFNFGLGLLNTEVVAPVVPGIKSGSELPNSPEVNFNGSIKYRWDINNDLSADITFGSGYKGDVTYDIVNQPEQTREDGYWLHSLRLAIYSPDHGWHISIYANNLTDTRYRTQVLTSTVGWGETWGMPRTFGITLDYAW